ncbi:ThiF family adenylyltransferase [Mesorhizobium sp. GR13]|uniref:HesA/MoeB/ThiF family protein n=1 Tax=Mesorhizobium sp. GR13 TaxID=2562308 RepID=UPI001485B88C|nr:ThiF family adenylyltransferase [Mesorhizobium sp. GR13]
MPEWSEWHLVIGANGQGFDINVFPDSIAGIRDQFPHQALNAMAAEGRPWWTGAPCLTRPISAFRRGAWSDEPRELADRVIWHIGRLLAWIDAAASGRLMAEGDPLELPVLPLIVPRATIGFWEDRESLTFWRDSQPRWGFATLAGIQGSVGTNVVADFMNQRRVSIRKPPWGSGISAPSGRIDAVWMVMPSLVVATPWRLPSTWHELTEFYQRASVDVPGILEQAGSRLRRFERSKRSAPQILLVGFPIAEICGGEPERMHWLAIGNLKTARRKDVRRGFSDLPGARKEWDRASAFEKRPLSFIASSNWAPDQLRRRGEAEREVRGKSVLLLGAGSLGSAVAQNLLRLGVTRMGIVDADTLGAGNLSRHSLAMEEIGWNKANALAIRLNRTMPDANIEAFDFLFPPTDEKGRQRLEGWDVVVDCTGEDKLLREMAAYPWDGIKVFVSLAMTWQASGMLAYSDEQASFPAEDAIERFMACSDKPDEGRLGLMDGIGCWHPVFPASADDVQLWAAIGTKFIRRAVLERHRICEHFVQDQLGAVERRAA